MYGLTVLVGPPAMGHMATEVELSKPCIARDVSTCKYWASVAVSRALAWHMSGSDTSPARRKQTGVVFYIQKKENPTVLAVSLSPYV